MGTRLGGWAVALLAVLAAAGPARAAIVTIETAAPLDDQSEESIKLALRRAVEASVQSALAMGIDTLRLEAAELQDNRVVVRLQAAIGDDRGAPDGEPERPRREPSDRAGPAPGRPGGAESP